MRHVVPGLLLVSLAFAIVVRPVSVMPAAPVPPTRWPSVDPLRHEGYTQRLPNSKVVMVFEPVPGGTYLRGSPPAEPCRRADEGPRHLVTVKTFWMAATELPWDVYDLYFRGQTTTDPKNMEALEADVDAVTRPSPPYIDETHGFGREGHPAVGMSHHAAMEFCHWLSKETGKAYRLPTEAEWEWAARAGTTTAYSFGDDAKRLGDYAWYRDNAKDVTHPVGKKRPNAWGLYDLHGNVAEWCLDHYEATGYDRFPWLRPTLGPVVVPTAAKYPHVARGGSYDDAAAGCRSAARRGSDKLWNKMDPDRPQSIWWLANTDYVGFRVVRAVTEAKELAGLRSKVRKKDSGG